MLEPNTKSQLNWFIQKLMEAEGLKQSTADDYAKRILRICEMENISLNQFDGEFEKYLVLYTEGAKKEIGKSSHNAYRSALLQYKKYLSFNPNINNQTTSVGSHKYVITVEKVHSGIALVSLKDANDVVLKKEVVLKDINIKDNSQLLKAIWDLMYEMVIARHEYDFVDILRKVDCGLIIDGKVSL